MCEDFDFYFMCKLTAETFHPDHEWEIFKREAGQSSKVDRIEEI